MNICILINVYTIFDTYHDISLISCGFVDLWHDVEDILAHRLGHHFRWPGDGGCHGACGFALRHHLP